jgi:putative spermidine/putrescine transport system substrate-binding protein
MAETRRNIILGGLATGIAPMLARPAIAQSRSVLRVQCIGGLVEQTMREVVIPEFQKQTPYDVSLIVEDDVTILPKIQVARSRAPYDVCMMDNDKAILGTEMGVWAPDQSAKLKNIGSIFKSCKPPATANYAQIIYEYALVYSTDKFKTAPTSWNDLWTPGIVAGVPHVSQGYGLTFLYVAAMLNGGSATNLDPGYAAIKRLGNFKIYKSVSQGLSLFQQKEIDAALFYGHRGQQMIDAGLPVAKTTPKEGSWGQRTGWQIPKLTANLPGAVAWIDMALSVFCQEAFAKGLYSPTNKDCSFPPDLQRRLLTGETTIDSIREAPWGDLLPQRDAILDRWTREFGS